ncbi:hypothetical protein ACRALDRAFT_2057960 [Sodiomyces alcalophilus JCM 7366]|uniref:uncharacterized protein n=1 Tax=Sodiomyces alcalophilus JCM 7366 TaxID=591952 RepID=UPI0039B39284
MPTLPSPDTMKTFFVWQRALGAPLEFSPALGTQELDDLIHAYIPAPASIQEKRALISLDFFEYAQITGSTVKYYSVDVASMSKVPSPAGSGSMQDSGHSSHFVSPATSNWSWPSQSATPVSVSASTPSPRVQDIAPPKSRSASSKKISSRGPSYNEDFSHIPGMKIMTKDGRDVTNSASRGCKTKEQRDHAHLMRIIKACDSCRRKKVRCDPSHKKRTSGSQASTRTPSESQPHSRARAARPVTSSRKSQKPDCPKPAAPTPLESTILAASFSELDTLDTAVDISEPMANHQDPWEVFVQYDEEPYIGNVSSGNLFFNSVDYTSPTSNLSISPTQSSAVTQPQPGQHAPLTELQSSAHHVSDAHAPDSHPPNLPYLSGASGSNYVDFNLYSPATSFTDEESMPLIDVGANLSGNLGISSFDTNDSGLLEEFTTDWAASQRPVTSSHDQQGAISSTAYSELGSQPVFFQPRQSTVQAPEWDETGSPHDATASMRSGITRIASNSTTPVSAVVSDVGPQGHLYYAASTAQDPTRPNERDAAGTCRTGTADQSIDARPVPVASTEELDMQSNSRLQPIALGSGIPTAAQTETVHANSITTTPSGSPDTTEPGPSWEGQARDAQLSARGTSPQASSPGHASTVVSAQGVATSSNAGPISGAHIPCEVSGISSQYEASPTQYATIATVALGMVTLAVPLSLHFMVRIVAHFTLGLMALGSVFGPDAVCPGFYDQRSHGTKDRTQSDKPASAVSRRRGDWTSRIHGLCRQKRNAHTTAVVGRLATRRLLALTQ